MGFTPLEGLMMGTRSGSVDPGILTYLMRQRQFSGQQLDEILNQKSGIARHIGNFQRYAADYYRRQEGP